MCGWAIDFRIKRDAAHPLPMYPAVDESKSAPTDSASVELEPSVPMGQPVIVATATAAVSLTAEDLEGTIAVEDWEVALGQKPEFAFFCCGAFRKKKPPPPPPERPPPPPPPPTTSTRAQQ